jgi:hypothetical protein
VKVNTVVNLEDKLGASNLKRIRQHQFQELVIDKKVDVLVIFYSQENVDA